MTALFLYSNGHILLYAHILRAKNPCPEMKYKYSEPSHLHLLITYQQSLQHSDLASLFLHCHPFGVQRKIQLLFPCF